MAGHITQYPELAGGFTVDGVEALDSNRRKTGQVLFCNSGRAIASSGFAYAADGSFTLATNLSSKTLVIPIHGLKAGDQITSFKVLGSVGGTGGNATTVDADLRKVTGKSDGTTTDASIGAITQVSATANALLASSKTVTAETVATTYQYYVLITVTTANNAACKAVITGVEVTVNRK